MVFQVLIHVQGVQVLAIKTGEQHIHHNGDVNLVFVGIVFVTVLLIFDAALHILIVQVKIIDIVIGVELGIVIRNDFLQSEEHTSELQSRPHLVCRLLLEKKKKNI